MKLSEAIMLGSTMRPQAFYALLDENGGSCAVGAAFDAVGKLETNGEVNCAVAPEGWSWAWGDRIHCPQCGKRHSFVSMAIVHLNNDHRWTRERIAEWISTIEPKDTVAEAQAEAREEIEVCV